MSSPDPRSIRNLSPAAETEAPGLHAITGRVGASQDVVNLATDDRRVAIGGSHRLFGGREQA